MHEGACCSELGLPGWPALAEELMVQRDVELARLTGARIHLLHLSTAGSVDLVRRAKADGVTVTAEAAPHHFSLTDEVLRGYDPLFKVNPPLRTAVDVEAVKATMLAAYRWQYIVSGVQNERFMAIIGAMVSPAQMQRIVNALAPIMSDTAMLAKV